MPNRLTCISLHHAGFNSFSSSTGLPHAPNQVDIHDPRLASFGLRHQSMATLGARRERGAARPERHPPSRRLTVCCSASYPWPFPLLPTRLLPRVLTPPPQVTATLSITNLFLRATLFPTGDLDYSNFSPCFFSLSTLAMDRDEELVDDSELCGKLSNDGLVFYRLRDNLDRHAEIDQLDVQEEWRRVDVKDGGHLGRGRFGEVFKEECMRDISGMHLGHFRAVKVIERGKVNTKVYYREELKALAKFSHAKVSALVISFKFSAYSPCFSITLTLSSALAGTRP